MPFDSKYYTHDSDRAALVALKAIPGFSQLLKAFMNIWYEKQFRIINMSGCIKASSTQLSEYYNMLPPICEKLGIDVPELYLQLDVNPNAYTYGDTTPFIVITSGLIETMPPELIPTVLAHECGHIACHHVLYRTMGNIILSGASAALGYVAFGGLLSLPLKIAFAYWMRCSELSADRAAALCDGSSEKMAEVCMRLAGYDKDIDASANLDEFMQQANEYKELVKNSKWDKMMEFLILYDQDHPLTAVRALECSEWSDTGEFESILKGTYTEEDFKKKNQPKEEQAENPEKPERWDPFKIFRKPQNTEEANPGDKASPDTEEQTASADAEKSAADSIREYKALLDDGIITQEEFDAKKNQLLNL